MLYTVADGASDRSFGVHVARLANFPQEVVDAAARMAAHIENFAQPHEQQDEQGESKQQQEAEAAPSRLTDEQEQLLSQFRRDFSAGDDAAALLDKFQAFQTEHAALIAAATRKQQQPDLAAMDES